MGIGHCSPLSNAKRKLPPGSPQSTSAKRRKPRLRISSLPNDILSSITSKLSLKEAARTSILSSQWRRVWLCRAYIDLSHHTVLSESDKERSWTGPRGFIFNELPATLPRLEMLSLSCTQLEKVDSVSRLSKFRSLHHLILNWTISDSARGTTDILDLGCLLEAAPFMEKLELHMVMDHFLHKRYCHEDGELRSLPSCPHSHLSLVHISGFIGEKDQLELALHILHNAAVLKALKIDPWPRTANPVRARVKSENRLASGWSVALEFLCKDDHRNVVSVLEDVGE
ncbi:hypothetical protein CFC21_094187 [Triticum aestivum]|uniref:F-box domain-containing protein n=2 Tax=Triticum aestivum TaxID=4565 RepID=A0A9R1MW68_WHEAT|nr:hypothetical protein CFC21_094187 [Triticum aestivum]